MARKRLLLTGIGGFIGAHCLDYFLDHTDWEIVGIDSFRHKGTCSRVEAVRKQNALFDSRVKVYRHDLIVPIDRALENQLLARQLDARGNIVEKPIDYIINMASDSAVERSTVDPTYCVRNNVELALTMLEFARRNPVKKFLQISTDECYGDVGPDDPPHKEWSTILPSNPYAASKAAMEAVAISYWRTYDLPIVITSCMNIIGEWQDPEKFLPKIIQFVAQDKVMPIYGDGPTSIGSRVYLHAGNKADALIYILEKLPLAKYSEGAKRPDRYNICGDAELNNLELAKMVAEVMGKELKYELIPSESARPGYDRRYALDGSKLSGLGWKMPMSFRESLERVVNHTLKNEEWLM
jgi:dTDP-glucose 4,6-dehydratase